jgi:hypothetical protein
MVLYFIHDAAVGFALFELKGIDEANAKLAQIQTSISQFTSFSKILKFIVKSVYSYEL